MRCPADHPKRIELNDEAHARTPEALVAPQRISYLTLFPDRASNDGDAEPVRALARRFGVEPPAPNVNHYSCDFGTFRIRWERHTEFNRFTFFVDGIADLQDPFQEPALDRVPGEWLQTLGGQTLVAIHAAFVPSSSSKLDIDSLSAKLFSNNVLVGSAIGSGSATALTDARIREDGFSRLLVVDQGMTPRQAGRMVQRLMEIETYRMMALLALPLARELGPFLSECERELAGTMETMVTAKEKDEPVLLDSLTQLEASIESRHSRNEYRFGAAAAYYQLVQRRIQELRETRLPGLQTFQEFIERRLAPAMNTCHAVRARQEALSSRLARGNQLLSTRVEVTRQRQNQSVLESMNRRARLQLRLQETVEGLSIAAVSYYIAGLVGYLAKGASAAGANIQPDVATAISIPFIVVAVALGVRQIRRAVTPMWRWLKPW